MSEKKVEVTMTPEEYEFIKDHRHQIDLALAKIHHFSVVNLDQVELPRACADLFALGFAMGRESVWK